MPSVHTPVALSNFQKLLSQTLDTLGREGSFPLMSAGGRALLGPWHAVLSLAWGGQEHGRLLWERHWLMCPAEPSPYGPCGAQVSG